jgi:hypothetical protein
MSPFIYVLLIVIALAIVIVFTVKRRQASAKTVKERAPARTAVKTSTSTRAKDYRAASLQVTKTSCPAAKSLAAKRLLVSDTPAIPLKDCDRMAECTCTYRKHEDRRQSDDRRNHSFAVARMAIAEANETDRRALTDRRKIVEEDFDIFEFK